MQVTQITGIFNPQNVNNVLIKDPTPVNFTNQKDVAQKMEQLSNVDGVNVDSMNATTVENTRECKFNVTIEALGYAAPNSTSGQIVISQQPSYKVIVKAVASYRNDELIVDTNTMQVESVLKLFK